MMTIEQLLLLDLHDQGLESLRIDLNKGEIGLVLEVFDEDKVRTFTLTFEKCSRLKMDPIELSRVESLQIYSVDHEHRSEKNFISILTLPGFSMPSFTCSFEYGKVHIEEKRADLFS